MKRILSFLLVLSIFSQYAEAEIADSTKVILNSSGLPQQKVHLLNGLAARYIENDKLAEAENAAQTALEMIQLSQLSEGKSQALDNMGQIAMLRFDYKNAMNFFVESMRLRDGLNDKVGQATSKNLIGKVIFMQRDLENALTNFQSALQLLGEDPQQLPLVADIHRNMGELFLAQKLYGKATAEYDQALQILSEAIGDFKKAATLASHLGEVVANIGDNDGALTYFNSSLNFHRNLNDVEGMARDFLKLSQVYTSLNETELALQNAENALAAFQQVNNAFGAAQAFAGIGTVCVRAGDRAKAETNFDKGAEILRGLPFQPDMPEVFKSIAEGFSEIGNFPKAYNYAQLYAASKDSLFNKEKATALLEMTTKYESEFAVKEKNRQLAVLEKEKAAEMQVRWMLIGLIVLGLLALYMTYSSYRIKQADNKKLMALNAEITGQKAEITRQNEALHEKNSQLDMLNGRLIEEIAERENSQRSLFNKDHFLANVTSRMRQPLNDIVNLSQNLMTANPSGEQKEHIQSLQFAANNLVVLINDVLDFSNIEAGKLALQSVAFSAEEIVYKVKKNVKPVDGVKFDYALDTRIPQHLNGDPVRLTQIMTYLLGNISQQITEGGISVSATRHEVIGSEMTLKIDVQAKGLGLNFERLDLIFNKNAQQEDFETLTAAEMELIVSRRLVELQNGTINASRDAQTTIISLYLPYKIVETEKKSDANDAVFAEMADSFLEGKRILVVEDNKVNQMLVANMLKKRGIVVTTANDGLEGLEAMQNADFDLVLMDIQMPRMDGYRAVAEIRRMKEPLKAAVPIIALTASAYINEKEKAQLFGMTDHIGKPFSPEELLEKVTRVMLTHKAHTDNEIKPSASSNA